MKKILFIIFLYLFVNPAFAAFPVGIFDGVNTADWTLHGWAYDPDSVSTSINVHVYVEGPAGSGYLLGGFPANLARNDVNTAIGITGKHGFVISIPEYLQNQYHTFYIYGIDATGNNNALLAQSPKSSLTIPNPSLSINGIVDGATMTISTSKRTAGAIDSLIWKNKQFINATDHGRELQTASSFDGYGESFNPTEAGNIQDGSTSSSVLNYSATTNSSLTTIISPAYWHPPGYEGAFNTSIVSNHLIRKDVVIGNHNLPNIIEYKANFYLPIPHQSATFEVVTGYMTNDFTSYWKYNPQNDDLQPSGDRRGEQSSPLIFSTPDQQYAMGIYSPGLPQSTFPNIGYGQFNFSGDPASGTNKWNCVYRESNLNIGNYSYTCYIAIGSLNTVRAAIRKLYIQLQPTQTPTPTPTLTPTVTSTPIPTLTPTIIKSFCTQCSNLSQAKSKGDADCSTATNINDASIWRSEFIAGEFGSTVKNTWSADFDCDGKVTINDVSIWRENFIKTL